MAAIPAPQSPKVGDTVRCFFGIGTLEHVTGYGWAQVRISPGWLHSCPMTEVYSADLPQRLVKAVRDAMAASDMPDLSDPRCPLRLPEPSRRYTWGALACVAALWLGVFGFIGRSVPAAAAELPAPSVRTGEVVTFHLGTPAARCGFVRMLDARGPGGVPYAWVVDGKAPAGAYYLPAAELSRGCQR